LADYIAFTEEMKKDYTVLIPTMLPMHFELIASVMRTYGYKVDVLEKKPTLQIAETGLRYVHNDTCYPAILVIGQFLDAIQSGRYDTDKIALIYFQTGGGCRASNYISLLRKALKRAGYENIPVISISFSGLEKHPGVKLSLSFIKGIVYGIMYGDLLMSLVNQCRTYETNKGQAQALADEWTRRLGEQLGAGARVRYRKIKKTYAEIISDFAKVPRKMTDTVKVGIVGEIYVKYSPLGNNDLEEFLVSEGAEVVVPGLLDFFLYCVYNSIEDFRLYGRNKYSHHIYKAAYGYLCKRKNDISAAIIKEGTFEPMTPFEKTVSLADGYINRGTKMGEGWLLTAEMLELSEAGVKNIVCTQPFGCLPNHICGKGMMKPIKEKNPDVNIVAIDYDAGATKVNQENRLKLMLSNARAIKEKNERRESATV